MIKLALVRILEKVSLDCSTGAGKAIEHEGWELYRTKHLDVERYGKTRDEGYTCVKFQKIIAMFLKHKRITIRDGHYNLLYREDNAYQEIVLGVDTKKKKMTVITIIQLSLEKQKDYHNPKNDRKLFIGNI